MSWARTESGGDPSAMGVDDVRVILGVVPFWDIANRLHEAFVEQDVAIHNLSPVSRSRPEGNVLDYRRAGASLEPVVRVAIEEQEVVAGR